MSAKYSIGIDLGTTNSAMSFMPLYGEKKPSEVALIPQWETPSSLGESTTLPSFLYLPLPTEAGLFKEQSEEGDWMVGRYARKQAAEMPGRVAHSAKSWLCHHAVDRHAPFLPLGSEELTEDQKVSPIRASAMILGYFKGVWENQFGYLGEEGGFALQDVTITVPASFDAAAQRLTLEAAAAAGYPDSVRLLEEPQAAFYRWLEQHGQSSSIEATFPETENGEHHVLVVDIGGGTSDFSFFKVAPVKKGQAPEIERLAVSDHILLGGDNVDLALAHFVEPRLAADGQTLSGAQWHFLVARCRDLKERILSEEEGEGSEEFSISVPGRGSSLLAGTLSARIRREEVMHILLEGFFPECPADAEPEQARAGLKEWGLPYAADSAVTRYLAEFIRDRPRVDAVLFNGGTLMPAKLRDRLLQMIATWQEGTVPKSLDNPEPDLAVARGAARYGWIHRHQEGRIQAAAARTLYLEIQETGDGPPSLVCVLPRGTQPDDEISIEKEGLRLRVNQPVRFRPFYSNKRKDKPGTIVSITKGGFHQLPPLQTVARLPKGKTPKDGYLPISLQARLNELGLLQLDCVSAAEGIDETWPLEFNLRGVDGGGEIAQEIAASSDHGVDDGKMKEAQRQISRLFPSTAAKSSTKGSKKKKTKGKAGTKKDRVTPTRLFRQLEESLDKPKQDWNGVLIRSLWLFMKDAFPGRKKSVEHEETWLSVAGFLLRPGYGVELDDERIDDLWDLRKEGLAFPGKRIRLQEYILWRRIAGGLDRERQESILKPELKGLHERKNLPAELIRLSGSLERVGLEFKRELLGIYLDRAVAAVKEGGYADPYFVALTLILNRAPLYAGPEAVLAPECVEAAYEKLGPLDWNDESRVELRNLFVRAARIVDNRNLDLPSSLRKEIVKKLDKADVNPSRLAPLRAFTPIEKSDQVGLYGESLPAGISLS
ncbi:MAG: Hsp70 family protein [Verrucomicrobiota bacterium]